MLSPPAEESHVRDPDWEARKAMNQVSRCIYTTYIYYIRHAFFFDSILFLHVS
jgi:hypothetical protein